MTENKRGGSPPVAQGKPFDADSPELQDYFHGIAEARYVIRKVFRLIDDKVRLAGLEPLEHQALIQVFGGGVGELRVNDVAEALDIAPAFASRLLRGLEEREFVTRTPSEVDRRATLVDITALGRELLARIDAEVQVHVDYFQRSVPPSAKVAALGIFAFYLGVKVDQQTLHRLVDGSV